MDWTSWVDFAVQLTTAFLVVWRTRKGR